MVTATTRSSALPAIVAGCNTFAPGVSDSIALPALLRPVRFSKRGDEAVAVRTGEDQSRREFAGRECLERRARRRRKASGQRLAIAARARQRVRRRGITAAGRIEEGHQLVAAALRRMQQSVAFAISQRGGIDVVALRRAHPALFADDDGDRLAGNQFGFIQRLRGAARDQRRAPGVAKLLRIGEQFVLDQLFQARPAAQRRDQAIALGVQFLLFPAELHFLQPRELLELGVEDVVGLVLAELEARDQRGLRLVLVRMMRMTSSRLRKAISRPSSMCRRRSTLLEAVLQAPRHGVEAERQPFRQQPACRFLTCGRPSAPMTFMLTR